MALEPPQSDQLDELADSVRALLARGAVDAELERDADIIRRRSQ